MALAMAAVALALSGSPARAEQLTYSNGDSDGSPFNPTSGTWDSATPNWWRTAGGGLTDFDTGDDAIFRDDTPGAPVVVTLATPRMVAGLSVESGAFTLTGPHWIQSAAPDAALAVAAGAVAAIDADLRGDFALAVDGALAMTGSGTGIGSLTVGATGSASLTAASAGALEVNGPVQNGGVLALAGVAVTGTVANLTGADLRLAGDASVTSADPAGALVNDGTLRAMGAPRELTVGGLLVNRGTLEGGTGSLAVTADRIALAAGSAVTGAVTLRGAIDNATALDLAHVPVLAGDLSNGAAGTLAVAGAVDGAGHALTNAGDLTIAAGGALTALGSLTNTGTLVVAAGAELGAADLRHDAGTLDSAGRIAGNLTAAADATLEGTVDGQLAVTGGTTTITAALAVTDPAAAPGAAHLTVGTGGRLVLDPGAVLTTPLAWNAGTAEFGAGSRVAGNLRNSGTLAGAVDVTGNLILAGAGGLAAGATTAIGGRLVNELTAAQTTSTLSLLGAATIENRAGLTVDSAYSGGLVNAATGHLGVQADVTGRLVSAGDTVLGTPGGPEVTISDGLEVAAGTATIAGDAHVLGTAAENVTVAAPGTLDISGGNLAVQGNTRSEGTLNLAAGRTLTTDRLIVAGGTATLAGTVAGETRVQASGTATLAGARLTGRLDNFGTLTTGTTPGGAGLRLEGGVVNEGTATIGLPGERAQVTGDVLNRAAGTLVLTGDVGGVVNAGHATLIGTTTMTGVINQGSGTLLLDGGTIAGTLNNRDAATVQVSGATAVGTVRNASVMRVASGGALTTGALLNAATGALTVEGTVNGGVTNAGTTTLTGGGRVTGGAIENLAAGRVEIAGTATAGIVNRARGTIAGQGALTGNVTNDGLMALDGDLTVNGSIVNNARLTQSVDGTTLRVAGTLIQNGHVDAGGFTDMTIAADAIDFAGDMNIGAGVRLKADLGFGGHVGYGADQLLYGDVTVRNTGQLDILAQVDGQGTSRVTNQGQLTLSGGGQLVGLDALSNQGLLQLGSGTRIEAASLSVGASGEVVNDGTIRAATSVAGGGILTSTGRIEGGVVNAGVADLSGTVTGPLATAAGGVTHAGGSLDIGGSLSGSGQTLITGGRTTAASVANGGLIDVAAGARLDIAGTVANAGTLTTAGIVTGTSAQNTGTLSLTGAARLAVSGGMQNRIGGTFSVGSAATLAGDALNAGTMTLAGRVVGDLANAGNLRLGGTITGTLTNTGGRVWTIGDTVIVGAIRNAPAPGTSSITVLPAASSVMAALPTPRFVINAGHTVSVGGGTENEAGALLQIDGTLRSQVQNRGAMVLNGTVAGSVTSSGSGWLQGAITGDLAQTDGSLATTGTLDVAGQVELHRSLSVAAGTALNAAGVTNHAGATMTVLGAVGAPVINAGAIRAAGPEAAVGTLQNSGTVDLRNGRLNDSLRVNGSLSGSGTVAMDLDLDGSDGQTGADRVVVRGGPITGHVTLQFSLIDRPRAAASLSPMTLIEADDRFAGANRYTFSAPDLPSATEKLIYTLDKDRFGNLALSFGANPTIGGVSGNIVLTQSLIGAVVNRPTSAYVTGFSVPEGEAACAPGAWARATAGRAEASGASRIGVNSVDSTISASYRGLQFGGDLACFDGRFGGWNMAFGAIGGVNDGSTSQPVYLLDIKGDRWVASTTRASVNSADFRQVYGGLYVAATRDRTSVDLQLRRERTHFSLTNTPLIANSDGLALRDAEFDNDAMTLSGALSYAIPLRAEGWQFVPTAGFAFSNTRTDAIHFDDGTRLEIHDSTSRVGFVGGTLSHGRVLPSGVEAMNYYVTGTIYKDFAGGTQSTFVSFDKAGRERRESLVSDNLGVYGELSLGASYTRVLQPGRGGKPRQFSASVRVDERTGDSLDSYGVTAQMRLQF